MGGYSWGFAARPDSGGSGLCSLNLHRLRWEPSHPIDHRRSLRFPTNQYIWNLSLIVIMDSHSHNINNMRKIVVSSRKDNLDETKLDWGLSTYYSVYNPDQIGHVPDAGVHCTCVSSHCITYFTVHPSFQIFMFAKVHALSEPCSLQRLWILERVLLVIPRPKSGLGIVDSVLMLCNFPARRSFASRGSVERIHPSRSELCVSWWEWRWQQNFH
jgi:hypothetical protein